MWAFDLLFHNGRDVRELPLVERKDLLMVLIMGAGADRLRPSDGFDDGAELLAAAERMGLEGVVSKRRDAPYRSGTECGWVKVKAQVWREANRERRRVFERCSAAIGAPLSIEAERLILRLAEAKQERRIK